MTDAHLGQMTKPAAILAAIWTVPVVIGSASHFVGAMGDGAHMPAAHIVGNAFAMWYVWIPATPLIFLAYRRLPFSPRGRWAAATAAQLAIVVCVFLAQSVTTFVIGRWTGHVMADMTFRDHFTNLIVQLVLYDVLVDAGVVAVAAWLDMSRRYRDRDLRASQLQAQLERTRLEALQMQMQPHFLFNALNSIAMLVRRDRKVEALDTVIGFSELLRYVLDEAGTIDLPLRDELQFVKRYLAIEQVRHQERLRVELFIAPEAEAAMVPNLILQPLVENALKHGVARLPAGGLVRISAERVDGTLLLAVTNDGPSLGQGFSIESAEGVGLRNLKDRLSAVVGDAALLRIVDRSDRSGVTVSIAIPFRNGALAATESSRWPASLEVGTRIPRAG